MVLIHVKCGEESQFLFETNIQRAVEEIAREICTIYNGRLKIFRICSEIGELANHGIMLPSEMIGLNEDQINELKLVDPWSDKCIPSGGFELNVDPIGRRNGKRPNEKMREVLKKAVTDASEMIDKKLIKQDKVMTAKIVEEALSILKGSIMIVYPMQLPPHDPIKMEFLNIEDLAGTQASKEVIEPSKAQLWFAGRQMLPEKKLSDYFGSNDKSKVIVKITDIQQSAPGREPVISEETRKRLMAEAYHRQEMLKKLEQDDDDEYLDSTWADTSSLKRQMHGLENVKFRIGK